MYYECGIYWMCNRNDLMYVYVLLFNRNCDNIYELLLCDIFCFIYCKVNIIIGKYYIK